MHESAMNTSRSRQRSGSMNLHIYPSVFRFESRILKETRSISAGTAFERVVVAAVAGEGLPAIELLDDKRQVWRLRRSAWPGLLGKAAAHSAWMWRVFQKTRHEQVGVINCHSLSVAPLALLLKFWLGAKLIYDTHELETETMGMRGLRRIGAKLLERLFIRFVDEVVVVSDSIAQWYKDTYRLDRVHLVRNVPYRDPLPPTSENILRSRLAIDDSTMLFLYQGVLAPGRGISTLIEAFVSAPPNCCLVLLGYGPSEDLARKAASQFPNIHFHSAVSPDQLPGLTRCADVGICMIEDSCLSYRYCLPNKLFEYVMNGVPVLVSRLPDLTTFVEYHACGWNLPLDSHAISEWLANISPEDVQMKATQAHRCRETLGWQDEEQVLLSLFSNQGRRCPKSAA